MTVGHRFLEFDVLAPLGNRKETGGRVMQSLEHVAKLDSKIQNPFFWQTNTTENDAKFAAQTDRHKKKE